MLKPSLIFLVIFVLVSVAGFAQSGHGEKEAHKKNEHTEQEEDFNEALNHAGDGNGHGEASHHAPPGWTVIPFIMLLLMIATGFMNTFGTRITQSSPLRWPPWSCYTIYSC